MSGVKQQFRIWNGSLFILMVSVLVGGCSSKNASHLPNFLELPGAVIGGVFENTRYKAKRKKVNAFVRENDEALRRDAEAGEGDVLESAFKIAGIKDKERLQAIKMMTDKNSMTFRNSIVVADRVADMYSALYPVKRADKKINGFTYPEINLLVQEFSQKNFDTLRVAIRQGSGEKLGSLATMLKIKSSQDKLQFNHKLQALYEAIYLEPIVVALMVSG